MIYLLDILIVQGFARMLAYVVHEGWSYMQAFDVSNYRLPTWSFSSVVFLPSCRCCSTSRLYSYSFLASVKFIFLCPLVDAGLVQFLWSCVLWFYGSVLWIEYDCDSPYQTWSFLLLIRVWWPLRFYSRFVKIFVFFLLLYSLQCLES